MYRVRTIWELDEYNSTTRVVHDPRDTKIENHLLNPRVVRKTNSVHTFEFTIREEHFWFHKLEPFKNYVWVEDVDNKEIIFEGRIIETIPSISEEGEYIKECLCEDALGYLNDSYQKFNKINVGHVRDYLDKLLTYHNHRFGKKQILLGNIEPAFPVKVVTQYEKTIDLIMRETVEKHGGYLELRYADTGRIYLDYLKGTRRESKQPMVIGTNLLNMRMTTDYTKVANKFTPVGAEIPPPEKKPNEKPPENQDEFETARPRVQIKYRNPGFDYDTDYIYDEESVKQVGEIEGIKFYDDITDPQKLLEAGLKDFKGMNIPSRKIELSALDLYELGYEDFEKWNIRDEVRVICYDLGIDEYFTLSEIDLPIDEPHTATYRFGNFSETSMVNRFSSVGDKISGLNVKVNGVQYREQIKLDDVVQNHYNLAEELTQTTNDLINEIDAVTDDLGVFKVETDKMLATKVANEEFKSYQIQVAGQLSSKVSSSVFESYRVQTDRAIMDRVTGQEFESFKVQTDDAISQMVKGTDFNSYVSQTNDKIALVVQDNGQVNSASIALAISQDQTALQLIADRIEIKPHSGIIEFPNGTDIDTRDSSGNSRQNYIRLRASRFVYVRVDGNTSSIDLCFPDGSGGSDGAWSFTRSGVYHLGKRVKIEYL